MTNITKERTPLITISRKPESKLSHRILTKVGIIVFCILLFSLITNFMVPGSFGDFFESFFLAGFRNSNAFLQVFYKFALLFGVCICLLPAFKMKYWNLGAAGQVLMGCVGSFMMLNYCANKMPDFFTLFFMLVVGVLFSVVWAVIPAIFKAFFNTNETLFTLMMNYIALAITKFCIKTWANNAVRQIDRIPYGFGNWVTANLYTAFLIVSIIILLVAVAVIIYLKKSKHGYEISVIGGSVNTARYVGINVKKVIIRTLALSGLISGIIAFLFTVVNGTLSESFNNFGYGFTGVLTLWAGGFDPILGAVYSFIYILFDSGLSSVAGNLHISVYISNIYTILLFLFLIGCDFFFNYKIHINRKNKKQDDGDNPTLEVSPKGKEAK